MKTVKPLFYGFFLDKSNRHSTLILKTHHSSRVSGISWPWQHRHISHEPDKYETSLMVVYLTVTISYMTWVRVLPRIYIYIYIYNLSESNTLTLIGAMRRNHAVNIVKLSVNAHCQLKVNMCQLKDLWNKYMATESKTVQSACTYSTYIQYIYILNWYLAQGNDPFPTKYHTNFIKP